MKAFLVMMLKAKYGSSEVIDTHLKNVRLDLIRERHSNNLAIFVNNHFLEGTHFTHEG